MTTIETDKKISEKLPNNDSFSEADLSTNIVRLAKHRRKKALGHIITRYRNDARYYYYKRGRDKEIYLGTAENIIKAVKK